MWLRHQGVGWENAIKEVCGFLATRIKYSTHLTNNIKTRRTESCCCIVPTYAVTSSKQYKARNTTKVGN